MSDVSKRIENLRKIMSKNDVDAVLIPSSDPHQSEYVAKKWSGRTWISGFTGSAGSVVVTQNMAGLWTDSRYFLQAEQELDNKVYDLHKVFDRTSETDMQWIVNHLPEGSKIALDGMLYSVSQINKLEELCAPKNIKFRVDIDLLNEIWEDRPSLPTGEIFLFDESFTGNSRINKLAEIEKHMIDNGLDHYLVSSLDDIAWLLNIRSSDIEYNPVCISYLLFSQGERYLYILENKINDATRSAFEIANIVIRPYDQIIDDINQISVGKFGLDATKINYRIYQSIQAEKKKVVDYSRMLKAVKNSTEMQHWRTCMVNDGVALLKTFMWLESTVQERGVSEYELGEKIIHFRSQQAHYFGESFNAIVGYKGNGAIVHYRADEHQCAMIKNEGFLLVDCGGQYFNGTTDITRTFCFSQPTDEQKTAYTAVLKGHISLATVKYPEGTTGGQLDIMARQHLWNHGLNYLHGTGHGVGFFLNVHEEPQGFAAGPSVRNAIAMKAGMVTSNEPGYYKTNEFGIRIENLILTVPSKNTGYLEHETFTMFPIETKMIDRSMMTDDEVMWLNDYHKQVLDKMSPQLDEQERVWLEKKCIAI